MADLGVFGGWIITSMGTGRVSEQGQAKASQDSEGGGSHVLNIAGDANSIKVTLAFFGLLHTSKHRETDFAGNIQDRLIIA